MDFFIGFTTYSKLNKVRNIVIKQKMHVQNILKASMKVVCSYMQNPGTRLPTQVWE